MITALINGRVLGDAGFEHDKAVLLQEDRIVDVVDPGDPRVSRAQHVDLQGRLLMPGFIDVQVNGGGGALFNDDPSIDSIRRIGEAHRRFGTTGFLPTLISDDLHVMSRAIAAVKAAIEARVPGVLGIHIEGPFLNEARKGVHDATKFRELDDDAIALLASLDHGRTLVTLAPEMTTPKMIRKLVRAGVTVSAGHTNAGYADMRAALAEGLCGFTHLFNAMSQLNGREPGAVGAALEDDTSWCGIISDGIHVHPAALRVAYRCRPRDRFVLVTDAMTSVGSDQQRFSLQGRTIEVDGLVCVDQDGRLAGSNMNMAIAVRNAASILDIDLAEAVRMASTYPAAFLKLEHELGRIASGYRANLVLADEQMNVAATWIDGRTCGRVAG
ncbi:MAG: N-acetylglucosamine-6-phosphate deacetylase [Xanthomonadaceae bacterium]|nr:N-acetylglucosamine-6-phosphate deacetylase [Xanthomonadaceae bacterium]